MGKEKLTNEAFAKLAFVEKRSDFGADSIFEKSDILEGVGDFSKIESVSESANFSRNWSFARASNKYWLIFLYSLEKQAKNWPVLLSLAAIFVTIFMAFAYLFEATGSLSAHISKNSLIWYCMLNEFMLSSGPWYHLYVQADIKNGTLLSLLTKPISYLPMKAVEATASSLINFFALGTLTIVMTTWWTGIFPFTSWQFLAVIFLAFGATILNVFIYIILGLLAFWVDDVVPLSWLYVKALFIFGGLFMPLVTYPRFLQIIADYTPFPSILGQRSAQVLLEPLSPSIFVTIFFWIGVSAYLAYFVYNRGLRHENRYGGAL